MRSQDDDIWYGRDFVRVYGDRSTKSIYGITYSWTGLSCSVKGTTKEKASTYTVIDGRNGLPEGMQPGDRFLLYFSPSKETVNMRYRIAFYSEYGSQKPIPGSTIVSYLPSPVTVPENAVGVTVQICVPTQSTVNYTVNALELIKLRPTQTDTPLMISFVDDDTSGWEFVTKYHDACLHNGVYGNYAVLTKYSDDDYSFSNGKTGPEMRELLLDYQQEGFGLLLHGYRQSKSDPWLSMGSDPDKINVCLAVVERGLNQMRQWGFTGFEFFVTPYGVRGSGPRTIAEQLGLKCLISTNNGRHNSMQDYDKLFIKRVALNKDDNGNPNLHNTLADVKREIDACVAAGTGWLIVTTHFNEWSDQPWESSLDENGYPVGYARFNEMVQYALSAGLTPVTVQEAWAQYEAILDANRTLVEQARAEDAFVITSHPVNVVCGGGETATFSVEADGEGLTYQWQYKPIGGTNWYNWSSSAVDNTLTIAAYTRRNGMRFRCRVRDLNGKEIVSNPVLLTVNESFSIVCQPEDASVQVGETAFFSVEAEGDGLTYQWQYKAKSGQSWSNWNSTPTTDNSLRVIGKTGRDGYVFRCLIRSSNGDEMYSDYATLTVTDQPVITTQPKSQTVVFGNTVTFTVAATGSDLRYQWQYKKVGMSDWADWTGKTESSVSFKPFKTNNGCQYRCVISNEAGSVTSGVGTLAVLSKPVITTQPKSKTVAYGKTVTFTVAATGSNLRYQWQYKKVGMSDWADWTGKTAASVSFKPATSSHGCQYRCVISNEAGTVTSNAATLTVSSGANALIRQLA